MQRRLADQCRYTMAYCAALGATAARHSGALHRLTNLGVFGIPLARARRYIQIAKGARRNRDPYSAYLNAVQRTRDAQMSQFGFAKLSWISPEICYYNFPERGRSNPCSTILSHTRHILHRRSIRSNQPKPNGVSAPLFEQSSATFLSQYLSNLSGATVINRRISTGLHPAQDVLRVIAWAREGHMHCYDESLEAFC